MAKDPLSQVYDKLWTMLEAHSGFTAEVKVGNRAKFADDARDPMKAVAAAVGRPTIGILEAGGTPHLESTSSSSFLTMNFQVLIITGDMRMDKELYPVMWAVYRAMSDWSTHLRTLTWNDHTYVRLARPTAYTSTLVDAETSGIRGWVGRWTYEVQMHFQTSALRP